MNPELDYIEHLIKFRLNKYYPSEDAQQEPVIPDLNHLATACCEICAVSG